MHHKAMTGGFAGFGLLIAGISCGGSAPPPPLQNVATTVAVSNPLKAPAAAIFGSNEPPYEPATHFPLTPQTSYGWRIQLPCTGPVAYRETMRLPAAGSWPADMSSLPGTTISPDGSVASTKTFAACVDGWIEHGWTVASGDPPGTYVMTVEIDGYQPQRWTFTLEGP